MDVRLSSLEEANLRSLDKALDGGLRKLAAKPLIRKVPPALRRNEDFKKYFTPKVISIGPFHYGDPSLYQSKEIKLKLAAHFVKNIGVDKDSLYRNMKKEIDGLRKCYDPQELEKTGYDNRELAWMFFVDGCAILQAVYMLAYKPEKKWRKVHECNPKVHRRNCYQPRLGQMGDGIY
ncbi:hypothetical protein GOBAR_DD23817 [Gossypium barbadense]|nr:hypothetical protein GOBAR_DD23817 [Gossypium barbadense]